MPGEALSISVPLHTRDERRRDERVVATMPVNVEGRDSTTRDLSASGLSFHADRSYEPGALVEVVIEYLLDGHQYPLRCMAEVVRSQPREGGGYTIGARLAPQGTGEVAVGTPDAASARAHLRPVD